MPKPVSSGTGRNRGIDVEMAVSGLRPTMEALKAIDPVLYKEATKALRRSMLDVSRTARSLTPVKTGASRRGIRIQQLKKSRGGFGYRVIQTAKGGSIIEFAARSDNPQGSALVKNLTAKYGAPGRFLWEAWDRKGSRVKVEMAGAIRDVETVITSRMNRGGGR